MTGLLVCSHRGPVSHEATEAGVERRPAGPGGLVPVMLPALRSVGGTWMFAPTTDADRAIAVENGSMTLDNIRLRLVALTEEVHREHYETVTNGYLGRIFHYLFPLGRKPSFGARFRHAWGCYRAVNELYAEAVRAHFPRGAILIEDMHLMLVAAALRRSSPAPRVPLLYFHHVPWSSPDYFGILPAPVREEILRGLLAHDAVAFHSRRWANAFGACCERFIPGAAYGGDEVSLEERTVKVMVAPAALDAGGVRELAGSPEAAAWRARFETERGERRLLVRVDRADLWKNVLRGLDAYEGLLARRPDLRGRALFLVVLSPTRMWIPEYRDYLRSCESAVRAINERFGHEPVRLSFPSAGPPGDRARALGALAAADAVLVNPIFDGLNMVAKEAVVVGERDPALILSENAGVHDQFGEHALSVNPFDVDETTGALERAFGMSREERARRRSALREIVEGADPQQWLVRRLDGWL